MVGSSASRVNEERRQALERAGVGAHLKILLIAVVEVLTVRADRLRHLGLLEMILKQPT